MVLKINLQRPLLVLALIFAAAPPAGAQDYKAALNELAKAERVRDPDAFASAARFLLRDDSARAVREVCDAYGRFASAKPPLEGVVHYHLHSELARALGEIGSGSGQEEVARQREKAAAWEVRCLCLDAASFKPAVFGMQGAAISRLQDKTPAVVRRALEYLRHDRQLVVVDAVIARFLEVDLPKGPKGDDWNRLRLSFRSALASLLKVSRAAAVDYRNYVDARRSMPADLFEKPLPEASLTRLSIFGMEVSGNNLAFVLDISGSMMSTDPVPLAAPPGRTETRPKTQAREAQMIEDRRRINRAKKELIKVVQTLPEGKKFSIIPYSSDVVPWKKLLVPVNPANRKDAVEYIQGLKAEGLTVTDDALEAAFTDLAVDTIYLITDGAPTHVGVRGPDMPPDAEDIIRRIHKRVREINYFRGVRIFTLGFPEAEEDFLKKLAAENAGEYMPIR